MTRPNARAYDIYFTVWLTLCALLAATVIIVKLNLLERFSVVGGLLIASIKAGLVLFYFMHIRHEGKLVKTTLTVAVTTLTLLIILTFSDIWYR
jgi:cytochrome c oxidase subunit IV